MGTVDITQEDAFIGKIDERLNVRFDKKDASKDIMIVKRYKLTYGLAILN